MFQNNISEKKMSRKKNGKKIAFRSPSLLVRGVGSALPWGASSSSGDAFLLPFSELYFSRAAISWEQQYPLIKK